MGFRINNNIAAMSAHTNSVMNNRNLDSSLGKLSSGLRIQTAADDASGMSIADSLRAQANGLGQAIKNGNDAIGIVQTADKAMDEQIKILDTIKTKAIQAAQDGQNSNSRRALQNDISRLLEELDNIAKTTSFNGQQLLNGSFSNKEFQIGAYSNETAKVSIGATDSNSIGHTRFETTMNTVWKLSAKGGDITVKLSGIDGFPSGYVFKTISSSALKVDGFKAVAEQINAMTTQTGVKASVNNVQVMSKAVTAGTIKDLKINGVSIGDITVKAGDDGNILTAAINAKKDETGVEASIDKQGKLTLATKDGRAIQVQTFSTSGNAMGGPNTLSNGVAYLGQLTFTRQDARDIKVGINGFSKAFSAIGGMSMGFLSSAKISTGFNQASVNLKYMNSGTIISTIAQAMGFFNGGEKATAQSGGVNTFAGAQAMIDIAESAQKTLDRIRADLGSVQNQLVSTINNISVTQVNVKSAESQIRDVDFAEESANFSKFNILAQSGSYAMSQANTVQQNVLRLLQ
ncbi:flagellin B [Campylobacter hyointestinalis]|uniref:Flagellin n=1 Tax=Campylobacter hyointestinalis subsp. hyointestinalis TaxID=91352 RepID=A0A855NG09_CAMHY|nr:flagellin B [Campylobacter hyointestinalis]PPB59639.1 flagellin B [Campylobacter hyointestinalis subsp. hyointestinalis]PPB64716.1 flagellin B [Campylobacter hyointestinalis subsp. hyointestinalis]PPB72522.1 flagellin B [Campylobacter hyointestinalis subsp. hyointestinalis]